jgi:glutamate N-acetyltransferase/amino-acid N-acetyltransferase
VSPAADGDCAQSGGAGDDAAGATSPGTAATGATTHPTVAVTPLEGGVCAVPGVRAAGTVAGLKPSGKPDLALVAADRVVSAWAVQTTNAVPAAPVQLTRQHLAHTGGRAQAVVANAGSANACTGADGLATAQATAERTAGLLGCEPAEVLVCSTGVIGEPIDRQRLLQGLPRVVATREASAQAAADATRAISTTDTVAKQASVRATDERGACVVGGLVKGSGMIAPELATMLAVITTDADVAPMALRSVVADVCERTFGRITVDECLSTNDAVVALATGTAASPCSMAALTRGLEAVCGDLAEQVVRDGEGASRLLRVHVTGAAGDDDAVAVARKVAASDLVKTALAGGDPNWGRVVAAVGAAGAGGSGRDSGAGDSASGAGGPASANPAHIDPQRLHVRFGDVTVCRDGVAAGFDQQRAAAQLAGPDVDCTIDLGLGTGAATVTTCDLTHSYVSINADYTT